MNRFLFVVFLLVALPTSIAFSQSDNEVFLYINEEPIYFGEFAYLYQKNLHAIAEEQQKDLDNYLDLFITYKLKVTEAKQQGLDEKEEFLKDIAAYRKDLTLRYLEDSKITKAILEDMYMRSKKEIDASHILINLPAHAYGKDTIKAYERIDALRSRAVAGEDFNQLAEKYSDETGAAISKGGLGYFSTMEMVLPFEDTAYSTPLGEVSSIIRTGYGYHILKVHGERPIEKKLDASHIMVIKSNDSISDEEQIQKAYVALQNGSSFADVAKHYSQDAVTKDKGGQLEAFGRKDIQLKVFTDKAYSLEEGAFSAPFKSELGWHIVKLNKRVPHPSKEDKIEEIKRYLESIGNVSFYDQKKNAKLLLLLNYELLSNTYAVDLLSEIDRNYLIKKMEPICLSKENNKKMFKLEEFIFYYNDFLSYLSEVQQYATEGMHTKQILSNAFSSYKKEQALNRYGNKLYIEDKVYRKTVNDYSNGLLIFNLMQEQVWQKATRDTVAQKEYYNKNQAEFDLPEKLEVFIYSTNEEVVARAIQDRLKSNVGIEEINKEFDIKPKEEDWTKKSIKFKNLNPGETLLIMQADQDYQVVQIKKYFPQIKRNFSTARNMIVQAYRLEFEKEWVGILRKKYKVKLKNKKWEELKSELILDATY